MSSVYAWHFLAGNKLRDGSKAPKDGEWLQYSGPIIICSSGLHASRDPFDALPHSPGEVLCLVECQDIAEERADKFVCARRRIVARFDATEMLRYYARLQAIEATKYWEPPEVVAEYLHTGDESIRDAAWAAARDAAWDAAWAAWDAAWAAWDAAWAAARDAAWDAARAAAKAAARAAARDAAWDAARAAARASARLQFRDLVYECFEGPMAEIGITQTHSQEQQGSGK